MRLSIITIKSLKILYRVFEHILVIFPLTLGSILLIVVDIDYEQSFRQVSAVYNALLPYYPTKYIAKHFFHVYCALVVILKPGLGLLMACALGCRNKFSFHHLSQLCKKYFHFWQAKFHKCFFPFYAPFLWFIFNPIYFLLDFSKCVCTFRNVEIGPHLIVLPIILTFGLILHLILESLYLQNFQLASCFFSSSKSSLLNRLNVRDFELEHVHHKF